MYVNIHIHTYYTCVCVCVCVSLSLSFSRVFRLPVSFFRYPPFFLSLLILNISLSVSLCFLCFGSRLPIPQLSSCYLRTHLLTQTLTLFIWFVHSLPLSLYLSSLLASFTLRVLSPSQSLGSGSLLVLSATCLFVSLHLPL